MWTTGLEQTMLFALVLGRWLMPRGNMTRDQLSALLMVDVGLGADILELFDPFKEPGVKLKKVVVVMGLVVFSWAFLQFPLVLTQKEFSVSTSSKKTTECLQWCCTSETLSLLVTLCMLDGPFFLYRISMLVLAKMRSQMMLYFVCKNFLTVVFVIYRLIMMVREKRKRVDAFTTANLPIDSDQQSEEVWTAGTEQSLELGLWLLSDGDQTCSTRDLLGKEYQ
ncbi:transmembrane protein 26-like isoform X2 [Erpetoichthys calabaricus]|nr:transmembrane protein 26-like isoform X2 [Erpetoichthys calabaricus]